MRVRVRCGGFLVSHLEGGQICHVLVAATIQKTVSKNRKVKDVTLVERPECYQNRNGWAKRIPRVEKIVLANQGVPLSRVAEELSAFYDGKPLLALKLQLNNGREDTWLSPRMVEALRRMEMAKTKANESNGNDAARRFWEKSAKLEEIWTGLSFRSLELEIRNFSRPFKLVLD